MPFFLLLLSPLRVGGPLRDVLIIDQWLNFWPFFFSLSPIHWEFCSTICLRCQLTWIQQGSGVQCNNDSPIFPSLDSSTQTLTNTNIFQPVARLTKRQAGSRHNTGYIIPFFLIVCREITDRPTHFWFYKKIKIEIRILIWRWDWQTNGPHETVARAAAQQQTVVTRSLRWWCA